MNAFLVPRRPSGVLRNPLVPPLPFAKANWREARRGPYSSFKMFRMPFSLRENGILDILNIAPEGGKNKSIKRRRNRPTKIKIGCQTAPAPLRGLLLEAGFNCCAPFGCCCATLLFVRINCRPEGTIRACFMVRINCLLSCAATNGDLTNNRVAQQHHPRRSMLLFRRNKRGVETPYPKAPRVWISPDLNF